MGTETISQVVEVAVRTAAEETRLVLREIASNDCVSRMLQSVLWVMSVRAIARAPQAMIFSA